MGGNVEIVGGELSLAEARSALAWWLQAGVDVAIQDSPRDWLNPPPKVAPGVVVSTRNISTPNVSTPSHDTLAELQQWLASSAELPLASVTARRILPHGPQEAAVMLLADAPALEDFGAGQPIGGDSWQLAKRMLAAIGISADAAYVASLACFHSPGARMTPTEREACAEIARRHIALVQPRRLLLLGDGPAQALLGKPLVSARGHIHKIEGIRAVATFHPRQLIKRPLDKSLAWRDLLLLMEDET
ncbi:MAG: uracil-DNA glycosylase [Sphingomicrobium sp.]